jgi:hypothetical protein
VSRLPDGKFAYQKYQFGQILEGLGMENAGIVYGYLAYFVVIWYIISQFGVLFQEKSGNPCSVCSFRGKQFLNKTSKNGESCFFFGFSYTTIFLAIFEDRPG